MGEITGISWCDSTFNPWVGCTKVSEGCKNCYAEGLARRYGWNVWGPTAARRVTSVSNWRQPLKWNAEAAKEHKRRRVFCGSLCDVFESNHPTLPYKDTGEAGDLDAIRKDLWILIRQTPWLDWLLLTKRPENIKAMLPQPWGNDGWPNVWLGTSTENQEQANKRVFELLKVPAAVWFLSCEPLLGPIDLTSVRSGNDRYPYLNVITGMRYRVVSELEDGSELRSFDEDYYFATSARGIDWVIAGGESGPKARPMHPDWARSLRDQCQAAGVPFFFKQHGEFVAEYEDDPRGPIYNRVGKKAAGDLLDGRKWHEFPG